MKLPLNCEAEYVKDLLTTAESRDLYNHVVNDYKITGLTMQSQDGTYYEADFGKMMFIDEWLYRENKLPEELWGKTEIWSEKIKEVKEKIEKYSGRKFNVAVCIYYPNGKTGVDYHSDYSAFGDTTVIPSLSLGEEREFSLREKKTEQEYSIVLNNGSLLIMGKHCQERYEHSLPVNAKYKNARLNITFRQYGFDK